MAAVRSCYSFMPCHEKLIADGRKTSSIRRNGRAARPSPGRTLHLFVGQRTPACRKIGTATCTRVADITVKTCAETGAPQVSLDGAALDTAEQIMDLVRTEGYNSPDPFFAMFAKLYKLPFEGFITFWGPITLQGEPQ